MNLFKGKGTYNQTIAWSVCSITCVPRLSSPNDCTFFSRFVSFPSLCRGFAHDKLRDFKSAVADYSRALQIDPKNAYAFYNRGISHDRSGDFASAIADFTKAISLLPTNADFYHNRGFCYRKQGNFSLAISDYTRALELDPRHFKAVYNRAFSYDKMGDLEEAVADYTRAIELEPRNANAYHNRGSTYDKVRGMVQLEGRFPVGLFWGPYIFSPLIFLLLLFFFIFTSLNLFSPLPCPLSCSSPVHACAAWPFGGSDWRLHQSHRVRSCKREQLQ